LAGDREVLVDLGTGDGSYVQHLALANPNGFFIGLDACRENLQKVSRQPRPNALYLIANAEALPAELAGIATAITINFPWGSLLGGLLEPQSEVIKGLQQLARPEANIEIRLNSSALQQAGWTLAEGGLQVQRSLSEAGFEVKPLQIMDAAALRKYPTAWAKRMGYGRDPHALYLRASWPLLQVAKEVA
jgi:16S rRNA (adenine(1408)-N(1))-methyltransferase